MADIYHSQASVRAMPVPAGRGPNAGMILSQALDGAGKILAGVAETERRADEQVQDLNTRALALETARARDLEDGDLSVAYARNLADFAMGVRDRRTKAAPGAVNHAADIGAAHDAMGKTFLDGVRDPDLREKYRGLLASDRGETVVREDLWEAGQRVEKLTMDFERFGDEFGNLILTRPDPATFAASVKMLDSRVAGMADLNANDRAALRQGTLTKWGRLFIQGGLRERPDETLAQLKDGVFNSLLDADAMAPLIQHGEAIVDRNAREAERAVTQAATRANEEDRLIVEQVGDGMPHDVAGLHARAAAARARGETALAYDLEKAAGKAGVNIRFEKAPLSEINLALTGIETDARWQSDATKLVAHQALTALRDKRQTAMKENPLADVPDLMPLDPANPASFDRRAVQVAAAGYTGTPLTRDEADAFRRTLKTGSPADQVRVVSALATRPALGLRALNQIDPADAGLHAMAMFVMAGRERTGTGAARLREALNGNAVRKAKPGLLPSTEKLNGLIQREAGSAVAFLSSPAMLTGYREAAANLYASRAATGDGAFDANAFMTAFRDAVGGIGDTGGVRSWRGKAKVIVPRGLSMPQMQVVFARAKGRDFFAAALGGEKRSPVYAGKVMTDAQLKTLTPVLLAEAPGRAVYGLSNGVDLVMNEAGAPFSFDFYALAKRTR